MSSQTMRGRVVLGAFVFLFVFGLGLAMAAEATPPAAPAAAPPSTPPAETSAEQEKADPKWLLFVTADEAATEKLIAAYFEKVYRKTTSFYQNKTDPKDVWISYTLAPAGAPKMRVIIDTAISARDKRTGEVLERRVKISAYYMMPDAVKNNPQYRAALLELNNDFINRYWVPNRIKITRSGNIGFETSINIPGPTTPVHPEMVWDQLTRMVSVWKDYYNELKNKVPLGGQ
ncbi:MAG: hypothetical protein AB1814_02420 [Thermodesulfobacteriota bacterium]